MPSVHKKTPRELLKNSQNLIPNVSNKESFSDLPEIITDQMKDTDDFEFFLNHCTQLAKVINIKILVGKAIELQSVKAAIVLISNNYYLNKLKKNEDDYKSLLDCFCYNLQWLQTISDQLSLPSLKKLLGEGNALFAAVIAFKAKAIDTLEDSPSELIRNLFKPENPHAEANLAYFIANPKLCSRCLSNAQINDMFSLAKPEQVLSLCWALIKTRVNLLKNYFTKTERNEGPLQHKIQTSLLTQSSKEATDFINYKPSLTSELFKLNSNKMDLNTFALYLLRSHKPRQILKMHGDYTLKQTELVKPVKGINKIQDVAKTLETGCQIEEFAIKFHLLAKFKSSLLKQALAQPGVRQAVMQKLAEDNEHKEWIIMHLKENSDLVKVLCKDNSDNFLKLLKLTDDPGEFLRKLAGKIESKDRARIIFQAVIQIARYTKEHPEYQPEFDKVLKERFWLNFGYRRVKAITLNFLADELGDSEHSTWLNQDGAEEDLKFILENENLQQLFNLNKGKLQQLARQHIKQQPTHKVLAEKYYERLDLKSEDPGYAKTIRDKSVYYALQLIVLESRQIALNEAIYGVKEGEQHPMTKKLISSAKTAIFAEPLTLLSTLEKSDLEGFYLYYQAQIGKINTIDELNELAKRFNGNAHGYDLNQSISERIKEINQKQIKEAAKKSLAESGPIFYDYAKDESKKGLLNHSEVEISEDDIKKRELYGAIIKEDWDFIAVDMENFKSIFLELMVAQDFQKNANKQIAKVLLDNVHDKAFILDIIQKLDSTASYLEIDKALKNSAELISSCVQVKGEWHSEHFNNMLFIFDKNNLTQAKTAAKNYLFTKGSLLTLMNFAQSNAALRDELLASPEVLQRFKTEILTEEESNVFIAWNNEIAIKGSVQSILADLIFTNLANYSFTNQLISKLSENKRFAFLKDSRVGSNFIAQNPSIITFKKIDTQVKVRQALIENDKLLNKVISIFEKLPVEAIDLFKKDSYELSFKVLNQKNLLSELRVETKVSFDDLILKMLEETFVIALLKDENKLAAINIVTSTNEKLGDKFWSAAHTKPKLIGQVIEAILENPVEINKHKDVIKKYFQIFASDTTARSFRSHDNIQAIIELPTVVIEPITPITATIPSVITPEKQSHGVSQVSVDKDQMDNSGQPDKREKRLAATKERASEIKEKQPAIPPITREPACYIEDIYKFLSDNRNKSIHYFASFFKDLQKNNPQLLKEALNRASVTDFSIKALLEKINTDLSLALNSENPELKKEFLAPNKQSKKEFRPKEQDKTYAKYKEISEKIKGKTNERIKSIKTAMFNKENININEISKIFATLDKKAKNNEEDKFESGFIKRTISLLAGYQAIKSQYILLEELEKLKGQDKLVNFFSTALKDIDLEAIAQKYKLGTYQKLNGHLTKLLEQANLYFKENKFNLAANYYQDIINACHEEENIDLKIKYEATVALISLLIREPHSLENSVESTSDQKLKNLFTSLFVDFSDSFINAKISSFPLTWFVSPAICKAMEENLEQDSPNSKLVDFIDNLSIEQLDKEVGQNIDKLKKVLEVKSFIIRNEQSKADSSEQIVLLKEIYSRDPNLLHNPRLTFSFAAVLGTTSENLDIVLFYLRNETLSENWFEQENITELYELGKQNELIRFVLTSCYPHLTENVDKGAFAQTVIRTKVIDSSKDEEKLTELSEYGKEGEVPPPPPSSDIPSPPDMPPPPSIDIPPLPIWKGRADQKASGSNLSKNNSQVKNGPKPPAMFDLGAITAGIKLKSVDKSEDKKATESPLSDKPTIAQMIAARNKKAIDTAWQAMMFDKEQQLSACGLAITSVLKTVPLQGVAFAPSDVQHGFADIYNSFIKQKANQITPERVLDSIRSNADLKEFIKRDQEPLSNLARVLVELVKSKQLTMPEQKPKVITPKKPLVVKALEVKPANQIESSLKDKQEGINLLGFLGHQDQVKSIQGPLIEAYEKYIRMQEKTDSTSEKDFINELMLMLEAHMLNTTKEQIVELHQKKENPGLSLQEKLIIKAKYLITQMDKLYKVYASTKGPSRVKPTESQSVIQELNKRNYTGFQHVKIPAENSQKLYDLIVEDNKLFSKEEIKQALGVDNESALNEFEARIWMTIEKIQKGHRITKDVLCGSLYTIANKRDHSMFNKDFDNFIWERIKTYAKSIGKEGNVINQLEQSMLLVAPTIQTLYTQNVFDKSKLTVLVGKDSLILAENLLADKINAINLSKPVFRDEMWEIIHPVMVSSNKEQAFNEVIWEAIKTYAANKEKSYLLQEQKPLEKKMQGSANSSHKFFDKVSREPQQEISNTTILLQ